MDAENTASKYIGRWLHRDKLVFRVWPKYKETHRAIVRMSEIPIDGLMPTKDGHIEAWHNTSKAQAYRFELNAQDVEILGAAEAAGAKLNLRRMVVRTPGTLDEHVKKECWLEIPFIAYPDAGTRTKSTACRFQDDEVPQVRNLYGTDLETELKKNGYEYGKIVAIDSEDEIDEDMICREVVENDAMIVFPRITQSGNTVSGERARVLLKRAKFWIVPGRRPDEDGGLYRGYQFCDRFIRWNHSFAPGEQKEWVKDMLDRAHEATREKGRSVRRVYFTENVIDRFATRVGMSRQRVTSRFLDDGILDWMLRSVDMVKPILMRETSCLLRGRVTDAVNAIEFYYRALGRLPANTGKGVRS